MENLLTYATKGEPTRHTDNVLEQYQQQRSPTFKGRSSDDPGIVECWLEQTKNLFRHLQYDDLDKVNYVTFMLEKPGDGGKLQSEFCSDPAQGKGQDLARLQ